MHDVNFTSKYVAVYITANAVKNKKSSCLFW